MHLHANDNLLCAHCMSVLQVASYVSDVFVQQTGTVLHSGHYSNTLGRMHDASDEALSARKTATDFLMLMHAARVVVLNPSTFSAVAVGVAPHNASMPTLATGRTTCALRRGRRCDELRLRRR